MGEQKKKKLREIDKHIEYFKTIKNQNPFESEGIYNSKNYE